MNKINLSNQDAVVTNWSVRGSYFESCNCEAVCPCRRQNFVQGGRSSYGICQFMLSWQISEGHAGSTDLGGTKVVMAGFYDDEIEEEPWQVKLFIDDAASELQANLLELVFLGRAGGNIGFTANIGAVLDVARAAIALDHAAGAENISLTGIGTSSAMRRADYTGIVSCGIPGHDHPGTEYVAALSMNSGPLVWHYESRCGFATDFHYHT